MLVLQLEDELSKPHLHDLALKLRSSKRTVFVAGAGISCNAGIPDFRSKDGLYALVKREFPGNFVQGKDLFDSILFRDERATQIFYSFMAGLRSATLSAQPTPTHKLLKLLKTKKKLMRCYTQNIDGLEERAGLSSNDIVQLHGDIHHLKCTHCQKETEWTEGIHEEMQMGDAPDCLECVSTSMARKMSGKRGTSVGSLRPNIVLYGEEHPKGEEIAKVLKKDCSRKPQLLVVAGTSLKVIGIKRLVKSLASVTHAAGGIVVFVNKSAVAPSEWDGVFDYHIMSDTDAWTANLKSFIPSFFERQTKIKVERIPKEAVAVDKLGYPLYPLPFYNSDLNSDEFKDGSLLGDDSSIIEPITPESDEKRPLSANVKREITQCKIEEPQCSLPAKRIKSDPYGETAQQNMLLLSPSKLYAKNEEEHVFSSQETINDEDVAPLNFV